MTQPETAHPALDYAAVQAAERRSRAGGPWSMEHLRPSWLVLAATGTAMTAIVGIAAGPRALLGSATGFVIVGLFFTFSTYAVAKLGRKMPHLVLAVALGAYVVKIVMLGIIIIVLPPDGPIAPRWMALAVVVGLVTWMTAHLRYIWTAKVFYTDPQ